MPIMNVDSVTLTKSGKAYSVKSGGKYYVSKALGIEQAQGKAIDAVIGSFKSASGATVETIEIFGIADAQPAQNGSRGLQNGPGGVVGPDRFYMPFVSNVVAHAIQSGLITESIQVKVWATAARDAALELEAQPERDPLRVLSGLDEDTPF